MGRCRRASLREPGVELVYADVVVTEKSWSDMIRRSNLEERFGTTVLRSLVDLPERLVTASRVN
jgi:hypothetical protein